MAATSSSAPPTDEPHITTWPNRKTLTKSMRKNGAPILDIATLEGLKTQITAQAEKIRTLKAHGEQKVKPAMFWEQVFNLLELKYTYDVLFTHFVCSTRCRLIALSL